MTKQNSYLKICIDNNKKKSFKYNFNYLYFIMYMTSTLDSNALIIQENDHFENINLEYAKDKKSDFFKQKNKRQLNHFKIQNVGFIIKRKIYVNKFKDKILKKKKL